MQQFPDVQMQQFPDGGPVGIRFFGAVLSGVTAALLTQVAGGLEFMRCNKTLARVMSSTGVCAGIMIRFAAGFGNRPVGAMIPSARRGP